MSISRIKPTGWAVNEKLTSEQITQLDINASSGIDKREDQTDEVKSLIIVKSPGIVGFDAGSRLSGSEANVSFELCDISTHSCDISTHSCNISIDTTSEITLKNGSKIVDQSGSIELVGSTKYVNFSSARTREVKFTWDYNSFMNSGSDWALDMGSPMCLKSTKENARGFFKIPVHDGATLSQISMTYRIPSNHFPEYKLSLSVVRMADNGVVESLESSGNTLEVPGTDANSYSKSGIIQTFTVNLDQNNVIDKSTYYDYFIMVNDEDGTGAVTNPPNRIFGFKAKFSNITSMKFQ